MSPHNSEYLCRTFLQTAVDGGIAVRGLPNGRHTVIRDSRHIRKMPLGPDVQPLYGVRVGCDLQRERHEHKGHSQSVGLWRGGFF